MKLTPHFTFDGRQTSVYYISGFDALDITPILIINLLQIDNQRKHSKIHQK